MCAITGKSYALNAAKRRRLNYFVLSCVAAIAGLAPAVTPRDSFADDGAATIRWTAPISAASAPIRGLDYGPFRGSENPRANRYPTKTVLQAHVDEDFKIINKVRMGNAVRIYGCTHNQDYIVWKSIASGLQAIPLADAKKDSADTDKEIQCLYAILKNPKVNPSTVPFAIIGNEALKPLGTYTDGELIALIEKARQKSPNIKFTTAHLWSPYYFNEHCKLNVIKAGEVCTTRLGDDVDVIFPNILPYWEPSLEDKSIAEAVDFVVKVYKRLKNVYPKKRVIISETGWPSSGGKNPLRTTVANQQLYWKLFLIAAKLHGMEYLGFEAFDERWKGLPGGEGPVGAHWGLFDENRKPKGKIVSFEP
jgi:exo-beta-1,3-glucanase (GH17 family)